jgi:hypothetical protein
MYNRSWGNMNRHIQKLSFAALSVSLCACSMLGERQESTRLDIDGDSLPQIKVIAKKTSTDPTDITTGEEANRDPFKYISLNTRYVHPTLDASKVVKEKKIGLMHVMQEEVNGQKQSLPPEIDTASLFFGLGGKITGQLNIIKNPDDDFKSLIKYDESAVQAKHEEMIQTDPACEGRITEIFAQGEAKFDLSQTQIAELANNTIIEEGKSLRDSLDKEIKEELAKKDPSKANEPIDVTKTIFGNLSDDTQNNIRALFKPDVGLLVFIETKHFSICIPESGENIRAYLLDNNGYQPILPEHVKATKDANGLVITINTVRNNVTKSDLDKKKLSMEGQEEEIPLGQLKFGEKEVPVFNNTHNEITEYVFHLTIPEQSQASKPLSEETKEKETEAPIADVKTEQPAAASNNTSASPTAPKNTPPAVITPPTSGTEPKPVSSSTKSKLKDHSPDMTSKSDTTSKRATVDKPKDAPATASIPPTLKGDTVRTDTATTKKPSTSVTLDAPIITKYKRKNAPVWYSPLHNGYEEKFYQKDEDGEWVYQPNGGNSKIWDDSKFQKVGFTDEQVNEKCSGYEYIRNLVFKADLLTPAEFNKTDYIKTANFTKTYEEVLYDQLRPEIGWDDITTEMVKAATHTPEGSRNQTWELKVCFDSNKSFLAFWSAQETRSTNFYWSGSTAVFTGDNPNHWYVHSMEDHFVANKKPRGFNSYRGQYPLSNLVIAQNPTTKEWTVMMQLGFKRNIPARLLMAYINRDHVSGFAIKSRDYVLNEIEKGFAKSPGRTETFVYGGFTFDPAQKGEQYAELQTPNQISANGLISPTDSLIPWSIGHIMFPGESNVLNLPVKLNKNVGSNNALAKK